MSIDAETETVKLDEFKRTSPVVVQSPPSSRSAAIRIWREAKRSLALGVTLLALSGGVVSCAFLSLPLVQVSGTLSRFPPRSLEQIVEQRDVVVEYSEKNMTQVLVCLSLLYIFMQSFAIPGTLTLSLMAGALLGVLKGLILVSVISTIGACSCYAVSRLVGRQLAEAIWPERLAYFQREVEMQRSQILSYVLFLRLTPLLPNTFINVASPIVHVPLPSFALGTIIGCIPNNLLAVNAGSKLKELRTLTELYDIRLIITGCVVGVVAMLPIWYKRRLVANEASKDCHCKAS